MHSSLRAIALATSIWTLQSCSAVASGFQGFPIATGGLSSWHAIHASNAPLSQIYSAIVERAFVAAVAPPTWYHTLTIDHATGGVYTIVVTNALGPVATSNGTAHPVVSHGMLAAFDATIEAMIPAFAATNRYMHPDNSYGAYTMPSLFAEIGVGLVTEHVHEIGGDLVTNRVARWTRSPERRWRETLIEQHWNVHASNWQTVAGMPVEWMHAAVEAATNVVATNYYPYVAYGPTSSVPWTVSLSGVDVLGSNRTESVTAGATSTVAWMAITNAAVSGFASSTGAWYRIAYTNDIAVYGSRPYRLYASDLDERWRVLDALRYTAHGATSYTNSAWRGKSTGANANTNAGDYKIWATLEDEAEADWADTGTGGGSDLLASYKEFYSDFPNRRKRAAIYANAHKYGAENLPTNAIGRDVELWVYVAPVHPLAGISDVVTHSDYGTGFTTGRWHQVETVTNSTTASVLGSTWFPRNPGSMPLPWVDAPETNALANQAYIMTFGDVTWSEQMKALIKWHFAY